MVPWAALVELIAPYYPEGRIGRPPFSLQSMLLDASNENIHVLTLSANELAFNLNPAVTPKQQGRFAA